MPKEKVTVIYSRHAGGTTYQNPCWWAELDWGWDAISKGPAITGPCRTRKECEAEARAKGYAIHAIPRKETNGRD